MLSPLSKAMQASVVTSLHDYLQQHFVDKAAFAALCGISFERLDALLDAEAIPSATYRCDGTSISSAAFGVIAINEAIVGEFYRPECARWAKLAMQAEPGKARDAVLAEITQEFQLALLAQGEDSSTVEATIDDWLPSFWDGTFGLCVADPSTGAGIANKELLQARLTALTDNGSNPFPESISRRELLRLIDAYANAAMPFSPAEYERSSRKRLVDELRMKLDQAPHTG